MNDRYTLHDFWTYNEDGTTRTHYEHLDDQLTLPDTYVKTTYTLYPDGTCGSCSKIITRSEYMKALDHALHH